MNHGSESNKNEWENINNWTMPVGFYFSKKDTRWLVPRRIPWMGWTFNIGNAIGAWAMLSIIIIPILVLIGVISVIMINSVK